MLSLISITSTKGTNYTVNKADVTMVQPWKFQDTNHPAADSDDDKESNPDLGEDAVTLDSEMTEEEDVFEEEIEIDNPPEVDLSIQDAEAPFVDVPEVLPPTRSGRLRRPPKSLSDYVWQPK